MAYTPINWQNGDTITAEKMNRMDNGWGVTTTRETLFDGEVTTNGDPDYPEDPAFGSIQASITAESIVVTFNGTEYVCPAIHYEGAIFYGGLGNNSPDFTNYPFLIGPHSLNPTVSNVATPTAGTFTLKIEANIESIETTTEFDKARGYWTETSTSSTLFNETVVTEKDENSNYSVLSYSEQVPDGALTVTFDGTDYTCTCSETEFGSADGSFEDYPFYVFWSGKALSNVIETVTEGTHTIAVLVGGRENH